MPLIWMVAQWIRLYALRRMYYHEPHNMSIQKIVDAKKNLDGIDFHPDPFGVLSLLEGGVAVTCGCTP